MAYFGPNAELLGNIKLRLWHYQKPIPDINAFVMNVSLFLIVDILSFVINGCLLWHFCKVNVIKLLQKLQKDFWIVFGIAEAFLLMEVIRYEYWFETLMSYLVLFMIGFWSIVHRKWSWFDSWIQLGRWNILFKSYICLNDWKFETVTLQDLKINESFVLKWL